MVLSRHVLPAWAMELDPGYALAISFAASTLAVRWDRGWPPVTNDDFATCIALTRRAVTLANGDVLSADLVLSAIGLKARTDLARAAGLQVNRGIVVNTQLQTSAAGCYALGDCAEVAGLHLPFVMPIMQQARALAKTLAGTATPLQYPAMPVVVKTPVCPTVVCPPPMGVEGQWTEDAAADGVRALYKDSSGALRGFALTGAAVKDKQALTKEIPNLL